MRGLGIAIDSRQIDDVAKLFAADLKQTELAARRALTKAMKWAKSRILRELPKTTNIPRKIFTSRIKIFKTGKLSIRLWVGGKPVAASRLAPKQTKTGVSTKGGRTFRGAFIAETMASKPVLRRVGKDRYPLEHVDIDVESEVESVVWADVVPKFKDRFFTLFEQELRWETRRRK